MKSYSPLGVSDLLLLVSTAQTLSSITCPEVATTLALLQCSCIKPKPKVRSHIGSIRDCGVVLKVERFSHLLDRSFGLGSFIMLGYLSLVFSLRVSRLRERAT